MCVCVFFPNPGSHTSTHPTSHHHHTRQYKKEYVVQLSGFPKHSVVSVQALRVDDDPNDDEDEEEGEGEGTARPMATVSTDGDGRATVRTYVFACA